MEEIPDKDDFLERTIHLVYGRNFKVGRRDLSPGGRGLGNCKTGNIPLELH